MKAAKKNLFGFGGKKKKKRGLVSRAKSAARRLQEIDRAAEIARRKEALVLRKLELAEAEQRRREWEKQERERRQREKKEERERKKRLLAEQAHRKREQKIAQRERESIEMESPQYRKVYGTRGRKPKGIGWEMWNPEGQKENGIVSRWRARRIAGRLYKKELKHKARAGRAAKKRGEAERKAMLFNPKKSVARGKSAPRKNAAKPSAKRNTAKPSAKARTNPVITPQAAKKLLRANVGNRPVDTQKVAAMAKLMERGIYKTTQPLVFTNGLLTDGQHRLLAVVRSGVPLRTKIQRRTVRANPLGEITSSMLSGAAAGAAGAVAGAALAPTVSEWFKKKRKKNTATKNATAKPKHNAARPRNVSRRFEDFTGRKNTGTVGVFYTPPGAPTDLAQLGRLDYLKLENGQTLHFKRNPAVLCASGGHKLYIGLKRPYTMPKGVPNGQALNYGRVKEVGYTTAKPHLYGHHRPIHFYHYFGEADGRRPALVLQNGRLALVGGGVSIRREGIVN